VNDHPRLAANETEIRGAWKLKADRVAGDPDCERIEWLIGNHLVQLATDSSGWNELHRDPKDGRLWELTWPHTELHGGGPLCLSLMSDEAARAKYGAIVDT
jgi:Immunity protein 27